MEPAKRNLRETEALGRKNFDKPKSVKQAQLRQLVKKVLLQTSKINVDRAILFRTR